MAFYLTPPSGNISLQKLTQFTIKRFNFLCKVYNTDGDKIQIFDIVNDTDTVYDSECLIEGSVKDNVSHFMLRLICSCDNDMMSFFIKAETFLFDYRFTCMTEDELCRLFKSADRVMITMSEHLDTGCESIHPYLRKFLRILSLIKGDYSRWRKVIRKYLQGEKSYCLLPFQTVLQFVANREVILKSGKALVPVYKLREVITTQFAELLSGCMKNLKTKFHSEDKRIIELFQTIRVLYKQQYPSKRMTDREITTISHCEVDRMADMFPPCMSYLHDRLRLHHRLRHLSRIQYSLFLKEAGLPVHEALMFWRKEYSQLPSNQSCCSHDWSKNEKRYVYNIRHLYGLEGSRINYRGHSCEALQTCHTGPQDDGGCPFKHFDTAHLLKLFNQHGITHTGQIIQAAQTGQYNLACSLFLQDKIQNSTTRHPVEYFMKNEVADDFSENTFNTLYDQCKENVPQTSTNLTVHAGNCQPTVHSAKCRHTVHSGNCGQTIHSGNCEQTVHSSKYAQMVHSGKCEQTVHSGKCEQTVHSSKCEQMVHSGKCGQTVHSGKCEQNIHFGKCKNQIKPLNDKTNCSSDEISCQDNFPCKQMVSTRTAHDGTNLMDSTWAENDDNNFTLANCGCVQNNKGEIDSNSFARTSEPSVISNSTVSRLSQLCKCRMSEVNCCQDISVSDKSDVHVLKFRSPVEYFTTYKQLMK